MKSESRSIHKVAVDLFSEPGLKELLNYELANKRIIDQFGRFPESNLSK